MLKSVRLLVIGLILSMTAASAAFAQNHPMPGHKSAPPVICTGCPDLNSLGQPNDGLPTWPYSGALVKHVGRYVDSSYVQSYQHWANSYRTARARTIRPALTTRGSAPPRLYIQIGNGVGAYSLDSFFTTRLPGGMVSISNRFGGAGAGREKFLDWDGFVYPEFKGSGWQIDGGDFQDPMSKAVPFDFDDRGYLYVATERFGWAVTHDNGTTQGVHLPKVIQYVTKPNTQDFTKIIANPTGVSPDSIVALKVGSNYYVVTASRDQNMALFNVTTPETPSIQTTRAGDQRHGIRAMAKSDSTSRLAYIDGAFRLQIFDYATFVNGGQPLFTDATGFGTAQIGAVISMDESGSVWTADPSGSIYKFTPSGSTYTKQVFTPFTSRFQPLMLGVGAGYVAIGGIDSGASSYDVRLLRIESNGLTDLNIENFFRNYYHSAPAGYAEPGPYTAIQAQSADVEIIKWGGKTYLFYSGFGLGDVFELEGGNSISVAVKGAPFGTANPNAKSTETGPFYADPVTFVANSSSPSVSYDVTWNFGNPESATANTGRSRTGENETHQYTGLSTAGAITAPKIVKAQAVQDPNVAGQYTLNLKLPKPRVGISQAPTAIDASVNELDVVAGDAFNDASDGAMEGHVGVWNIDGAITNLRPDGVVSAGDIGPHTLKFHAAYGPYDANLNVANAYVTPQLTVGYVVRPFKVAINAPTADATNVTFTATSRFTPTTSILSATTWNAVWTVNGVAQNSGVSTSAAVPIGTVPSLVLPKAGLTDGTVIGLTVSVDPTRLSVPAVPYAQHSASLTLSTPDPQITVTGCANAMSPCKFTASSISGKPMSDWTFLWTLNRPAGAALTGTGSTFEPQLTNGGNYTITLKATKSIFPVEVSKALSVGASLCGQLPQSHTVGINKLGCASGCAPGTSIEFAPTFQGYAKQACDSFSWSMGDGTTKAGEVVSHSYASPGQYTVTLTMSNSGTTTPLVKTTTVNITGGGTVEPPPGNACTAPSGISLHYTCTGGSNCRTTDTVQFTARRNGSSLQACDNVTWQFGDGSSSTSRSPVKTYGTAGSYTVTATVSNSAGTAPEASTTITISNPVSGNCSLAPSIGNFVIEFVGATTNCRQFNSTPCNGGETVSFSAPNYYYVAGSCDNFEWDFGDGTPKVSGREVTHAFAGGQTYNVKLRVYNNAGQHIYNRNVTVAGTAPTEPVPVISATTFPTTAHKGRTVTFTATSNTPNTTGWTWNFGDGTAADISQAGTTSQTSTITHTFASKGVYTVRVSARNSRDAATAPSGEAQSQINITDPPATPEYRYLLPVTAYTAGLGGSAWRTDVQIYNPDPQVSDAKPLVMEVSFKGQTYTLTSGKSTQIYDDFLGNLLDHKKEDQGPVIITTKTAAVPPQIWTRTYTQTAGGTFGQFVPAIRLDNIGAGGAATDAKYHMAGLRHDARYRTNVGFLNPNATPITANVTVYDDRHFEIATFPVTLQPFQLEQFQLKSRVANLPANAPFGVEISVPAGQWLVAYASFIDGDSNDPVFVRALPESDFASTDYKTSILPGVGHAGQWRSDVTVFNPDIRGMTLDMQYFDSNGNKVAEALSVPLEGGKFLQYTDILKQGVLGNVADSIGTLKIAVKSTHDTYPMTFARTYFDDSTGTFGQGIPGFAPARANVKPNRPAIIAGVRNTTEYYTNIGMINVGASDVVATVTLLDPTSGAAVNPIQYTIKPGQTILGTYNGWGAITQGAFKVEANGNLWAFVSIIDRRTKDPEYVPATPLQ